MVLEKTLERPLDCKEIKSINPEGNQFCIFIGRTDAEAPIPWPPDVKSQLIRKDPGAGKDWRQKKGMTPGEIDGITASMDMSLSKLREIVKDRKAWYAAVHGVRTSQTWLPDWTTFHIINGMDAYRLLVRMVLASWPTGFALEFLAVNITNT